MVRILRHLRKLLKDKGPLSVLIYRGDEMKDVKLSVKIIVGFAAVSLTTLVIGFVCWLNVSRMSDHMNEVCFSHLPSIQILLSLNEAQATVDSIEKAMLNPSLDEAGFQSQYPKLEKTWKRINGEMTEYQKVPKTPGEEVLWNKFIRTWEEWEADHKYFIGISKKVDEVGNHSWKEMEDQTLEVNSVSFNKSKSL